MGEKKPFEESINVFALLFTNLFSSFIRGRSLPLCFSYGKWYLPARKDTVKHYSFCHIKEGWRGEGDGRKEGG